MLKTLSLVLPVLIPSWRFFKAIEPSPRVQWSFVSEHGTTPRNWQQLWPRPQTVNPQQMLRRLLWNAAWNEALFVVSCAERIVQHPSPSQAHHSIAEINQRILSEIAQMSDNSIADKMQFRLVFVSRDATGLSQEILFQSDPVAIGSTSQP